MQKQTSKSHKFLKLTPSEFDKVGPLVKTRKPEYAGKEIIYPKNNADKVRFFAHSLRFIEHVVFLINLREEDLDYKSIKQKLSEQLSTHSELWCEAELISNSLQKPTSFGKHRVLKRADAFILANSEVIHNVIDFVYNLGYSSPVIDPDDTGGYA